MSQKYLNLKKNYCIQKNPSFYSHFICRNCQRLNLKTRLFLNRKQQLLKQVPLATFLKQSKIFYLQCEIKQLLNLSLKKND